MPTFNELVAARANNQTNAIANPAKTNPFANPDLVKAETPQIINTESKNTLTARPIPERFKRERAETSALKEKVDIIQLSLVMQILGASGNQDNDRSKWKLPNKGNTTVTGQKWWNLEMEEGGIGAVSLVKHAKDLPYPQAVRWLAEQFGETIDSDEIKASMDAMKPAEKKYFSPPAKADKNISFVKHYLRFVRKIPEQLLDDLISQGRIYADDQRNCVFATEGIAELRSSFDGPNAVKKLVPGSTRKKGFIALPSQEKNEKTLAICESSIDAMSYRALNEGRAAISSAGANRVFPRALAEESLAHGFKVVAAFDADGAGDKASQALFNHFYLKFWLKHKSKNELNRELENDELFSLLDNRTVYFNLSTTNTEDESDDFDAPSEDHDNQEKKNLLFFNKKTPFDSQELPPTILVTIKKNDLGIPQCKNFPIEVTERGYKYITETLGLTRDRPTGEKDWNEILKKATADYSPNASAKGISPT